MGVLRYGDWSLRAKVAALLVVACLLPLITTASLAIRDARRQQLEATQDLLGARGDRLAEAIDAFHRGHQLTSVRLGRLPDVVAEISQLDTEVPTGRRARIAGVLALPGSADPAIIGLAVLDADGRIVIASDDALAGKDLSSLAYVRAARTSAPVISGRRSAR